MRILIDLQACQGGSRFRGIGRYTLAITRALIEQGNGHSFQLLLSDRFPEVIAAIRAEFSDCLPQDAFLVCATPAGVAAAHTENTWRTRAAEVIRHAFIEQFQPDIVFIPAPFEGFWEDIAVSVEPDASYITAVTIHDLIPLENPDLYLVSEAARDAYLRRVGSIYRADMLFAISEYVGNEITKRLGIGRNKILVALNGVDAQFKRPDPAGYDRTDFMRRLGISRPFVFNSSPLEQRKNIEGVIASFARLPAKIRDAHQLVISGKFDDYAKTYIRGVAAAEGLIDGALVLTGYVSDTDLIKLYAECALYLFPAFSEGFGLPPLEAMACGAPVLVSNTTSLPEVVGRSDLQVDPSDPQAIAVAMENILTDPVRQQALRVFGPKRAAAFDWGQTARQMLAAFTDQVGRRALVTSCSAERPRLRLAFVCHQMAADDEMAGRLVGLISALQRFVDITLVTRAPKQVDPAIAVMVRCHGTEWLASNAADFDRIIYSSQGYRDNGLAELMAVYPGLLIIIPPLLPDEAGATGKEGAKLPAPQPLDEQARATGAISVLKEGHDGLPPLPLAAAGDAAKTYRARFDVARQAPLVVILVGEPATARAIINSYRGASSPANGAYLVIHSLNEVADADGVRSSLHLQDGIRYCFDDLAPCYRGLISAADLLLLASDVPTQLQERCALDSMASATELVSAADLRGDLSAIIAATLARAAQRIGSPFDVVSPLPATPTAPWVEAILAPSAARTGQVQHVARLLPAQVRDVRPGSDDIIQLTRAVESNLAYERPRQICFDVSAFASPGAIRRLDRLTCAQLGALLRKGGSAACAIYEHDGVFFAAHEFLNKELGITRVSAPEGRWCPRSGDYIIGLDALHSFQAPTNAALRNAHIHGAIAAYLVTGEFSHQPDGEADLADLVYAFINSLGEERTTTLTIPAGERFPVQGSMRLPNMLSFDTMSELPLALFSSRETENLEDLQTRHNFVRRDASDEVETVVRRLRAGATQKAGLEEPPYYAVMGHIRGSYSLAIINRQIATTLEGALPGRVRYLPFETDPAFDVDGVPVAEQALMKELIERPAPSLHQEIIISQHWPLMPPKDRPKLSLALFPWEESRVPPGIIATMNTGFDAIISPSLSTSRALLISGLSVPVATIGQPVDVSAFQKLAQTRSSRRSPGSPTRFVHISSCFPRKGVDLLLAAWAQAFRSNDNVELVIKTFPNPHNDSEAQLRALRAERDIAPVRIINREAETEEMLSFFANADVMVLPSRGEGYNLPALEAMAAGVPLIVSGHGGHRDFCGPEQARMVRYSFAYSGSHVGGGQSMWIEPDLEDLVAALKEYADPAHDAEIEARRVSALAAAAGEGDRSAWVRRLSGMIRDLRDQPAPAVPKIGWVSSWDVQCGIAQYSNYLLNHLSSAQLAKVQILSDLRTPAGETFVSHRPVWQSGVSDHDRPAADRRKAGAILDAAIADGCDALLIQHQDGLISWPQLGLIGNDQRLDQLVSVVILHNVGNLRHMDDREELSMVVRGLSRMSSVLVHNIDDLNFLVRLGLRDNLNLFPHGAFAPRQANWPRTLGPGDAPIIGSHGFFFRHKGIDKLIRTFALLRREWPAARLRLVNARFPGAQHQEFFDECVGLAIKLGIEDAIDWYPDFLPVETIDELLSDCDLIVLPYDHSDDSASGAIRTALASMVPLVATRVNIFAEFEGQIEISATNDPADLLSTILPLLRNARARREVQANMHEWLALHDWQKRADQLETLVSQLVMEKKLGWDIRRNS